MWVVERWIGNRLCYWSAGARGHSSRDDFAEDFDYATKLANVESAMQVLIYVCDNDGRITLHALVQR